MFEGQVGGVSNNSFPLSPTAERTGSLGCIGWILVILSGLMTILLFPFTIWFCLKVSELGAAMWRAAIPFLSWLWINPLLWSSCRCCRLFKSMSALSSSDWAASQTGKLKDQVDKYSLLFLSILIEWLTNQWWISWTKLSTFFSVCPQEFSLFCLALIPSSKWICEQFPLTFHHKR